MEDTVVERELVDELNGMDGLDTFGGKIVRKTLSTTITNLLSSCRVPLLSVHDLFYTTMLPCSIPKVHAILSRSNTYLNRFILCSIPQFRSHFEAEATGKSNTTDHS